MATFEIVKPVTQTAVVSKTAGPPCSDAPGLTAAEARARLAQFGPNAVREEPPHADGHRMITR